MIQHTLSALLIALPTLVAAETRLERFEDLSEKTSLEMSKVMVRAIETKGGDISGLMDALPDPEWDDAYREAGKCMLGKYEALIGKDGVDSMLSKMEEILPQLETATLENIGSFAVLPEGITTDQSADILKDCDMLDLILQRMKDSGYSAAIMQAHSTIPEAD